MDRKEYMLDFVPSMCSKFWFSIDLFNSQSSCFLNHSYIFFFHSEVERKYLTYEKQILHEMKRATPVYTACSFRDCLPFSQLFHDEYCTKIVVTFDEYHLWMIIKYFQNGSGLLSEKFNIRPAIDFKHFGAGMYGKREITGTGIPTLRTLVTRCHCLLIWCF